MFRTVISLKVAAIPHRHLYKVKTGLSMVAAGAEAGGGGEAARGPAFGLAGRGRPGGRGRRRRRRRGGRGAGGRAGGGEWRSGEPGPRPARGEEGRPERDACCPRPGPGPAPAAPLVLRPRLAPAALPLFIFCITLLGPRCGVRPSPARLRQPHLGAPRADPGAARPPRSSWRRREPGTAPGRRGRASRGQQAGQAAPGPGLRRRGGAARTRGRFQSSLFLFCLQFPTALGLYILASGEGKE